MSSDRSIAQPAYVVAAALLLVGTAGAKDSKLTSEAIRAEAVIQGTLPGEAQRARQVVVVVSGARTGAGLTVLQRLRTIQKDLGCEELLGVANLLEDKDADGVAAWCKKELPKLVVTRGLTVGRHTGARSRAFVFRQGGALAYEGRPNEALTIAVRKALARATPIYTSGLKTPAVIKIAERLAADGKYGRALKSLARHAKGKLDAQVDARLLRERIERHGQRELTAAEADLPGKSVERLKAIGKAFGKHTIGQQATDRRAALLKDPTFKKELKAGRLLGKLQQVLGAVKPCARCTGGGSFSFSDDDEETASAALGAGRLRCKGCRQQNRRLIGSLQAGFKKLARYGGTKAAARGKRLAAPLTSPPSGRGGAVSFGP